jgi:XapX domain-containing protein
VNAYVISLVMGLIVGALYGLIKVQSPAPPIIALVGLFGMVMGQRFTPIALHAINAFVARR